MLPTDSLARFFVDSALNSGRAGESAAKDLPSEGALRNKAENEVHLFAIEVVGELSFASVLQPLIESEAVEQEEQRNHDEVHEGRDTF